MTVPAEFFRPWETTATSFRQVFEFIEKVRSNWVERGHEFAWRGAVNAEWALDSSLHRRLAWTSTLQTHPTENDVETAEGRILADAHRWGLHWGEGRLPILLQLALLQHYGAPTRLIDITFNAWVGVFFAVEEKLSNTAPQYEDADGRLFAIGVNGYLINERDEYRDWEDSFRRPWPRWSAIASDEQKAWSTSVYAWRPPRSDARIAAQNGGFLFGGVPTDQAPQGSRRFWPKGTRPADGHWSIDDVRRCTSVAVRPHKVAGSRGAPPENPLFTLRIAAEAKPEIRSHLRKLFGYEHKTIYPDITGFASFGVSYLRTTPPPQANVAQAPVLAAPGAQAATMPGQTPRP